MKLNLAAGFGTKFGLSLFLERDSCLAFLSIAFERTTEAMEVAGL